MARWRTGDRARAYRAWTRHRARRLLAGWAARPSVVTWAPAAPRAPPPLAPPPGGGAAGAGGGGAAEAEAEAEARAAGWEATAGEVGALRAGAWTLADRRRRRALAGRSGTGS